MFRARTVPIDPMSGLSLGYHLVEGNDGHDFVLYSVGGDGVDNGGFAELGFESAGFSRDDLGLDVPFNRKRLSTDE